MKTLTSRQREIVRRLWQLLQGTRYVTVTDLVRRMGMAGESSLIETLESIERKGYLTIQRMGKGQHRFLDLTDQGIAEAQGLVQWDGLPVLGTIPAGPLSEAVQEAIDFINPGNALHWKMGDYFLQVDRENGLSMRDVGISPGSFVLLRPGEVVNSGDIVAALKWTPEWDSCEGTLKRVRFSPKQAWLTLQPENSDYEPIRLPARLVTFAGVYHGCFLRHD